MLVGTPILFKPLADVSKLPDLLHLSEIEGITRVGKIICSFHHYVRETDSIRLPVTGPSQRFMFIGCLSGGMEHEKYYLHRVRENQADAIKS